jgi:membrane fusion protein (multidrug efflux system)
MVGSGRRVKMAYREEYSRGGGGGPASGESQVLQPRSTPSIGEVRTPELAPPSAEKPGMETAPATAPVGPAKPRSRKKPVVIAIVAAAVAFGGYEGYEWWTQGRFMVSTDDAYVQADITILSAKVSGYVSSVAVTNNQSVKAGDLVAKIDDGDYRLALQAAKDKLATQRSTIERIGRQTEARRSRRPSRRSMQRRPTRLARRRTTPARSSSPSRTSPARPVSTRRRPTATAAMRP